MRARAMPFMPPDTAPAATGMARRVPRPGPACLHGPRAILWGEKGQARQHAAERVGERAGQAGGIRGRGRRERGREVRGRRPC